MTRAGSPEHPDLFDWPRVDVIIPVHDEAFQIAGKVENLRHLHYPPERIRFWVVDGASRDATGRIATKAFEEDPRFSLLEAGVADKTAQLNFALPRGDAEWILVTDADARIPRDALEELVREAMTTERTGAVGATVTPSRSHPWERLHWRIADRARLREAALGSASIVTGPCYLMRRGVVATFPADVVADDVHVAFRSASAGLRNGFIAADVAELRSPVSLGEMIPHKYRKARAYLREIFRFLPRIGRMDARVRWTFLRHAAPMVVVPMAAAASLALLAGTAARAPWTTLEATAACGVAAALLSIRAIWRARLGLAIMLTFILLAAMFSLPFFGRRVPFPKVDARRPRIPEWDAS